MKAIFIFVAIAVVILALTNPDEAAHRRAVEAVARSEIAKDGFWASVVGELAIGFGVLGPLKYNNYIVFSTTTYEESNVVAVGFLGNVVVE